MTHATTPENTSATLTSDDKKRTQAREFLQRYKDQEARIQWLERKIRGLKALTEDTEDTDNDTRTRIREALKIDTEEAKLKAERITAAEIYQEIISALDHINDTNKRDTLLYMYIDGDTQEDAARRLLVHPKTVTRWHRAALLTLSEFIK